MGKNMRCLDVLRKKGGDRKDAGMEGVTEREEELASVAASILVIYSVNVLAPFCLNSLSAPLCLFPPSSLCLSLSF